MGMLINGRWTDDSDVAQTDPDGRWRRTPAAFRHWITPDGSPGPTGQGGFEAEPGRYHLYAAWNCPWAHRALLVRAILGLETAISVSMVAPRRTGDGWVFDPDAGYVDELFGCSALHEVYTRGDPAYTGRVTVPLLWDTKRGTAVSNESADIVRMLNLAFGPSMLPRPISIPRICAPRSMLGTTVSTPRSITAFIEPGSLPHKQLMTKRFPRFSIRWMRLSTSSPKPVMWRETG